VNSQQTLSANLKISNDLHECNSFYLYLMSNITSPVLYFARTRTTPLRLIQLLDSTPNNPTFDLFHPDTFNSEQFNFRPIRLMNNSTPRFFDTFNSEQSNLEQSNPEQSNSFFAKYDACNIYLTSWHFVSCKCKSNDLTNEFENRKRNA
jgi:hypothetical protein